MQMKMAAKQSDANLFEYYMIKTYYKTASLIANSCKVLLPPQKKICFISILPFSPFPIKLNLTYF